MSSMYTMKFFTRKKMGLHAIASLVLFFCGLTSALSAPQAPQDLSIVRYSNKNAEIFWERSDEPTLNYEIWRNSSLIGSTDGVSFYDDELQASVFYQYQVVAVDVNNERSTPAIISTGDGADEQQPSLSAPSNLRSTLYSRSAAELFWDRSDEVGLRYEVRRDGDLLGITEGISFFDDQLRDARTHVYEIVAVSLNGDRSAPSFVRLVDQEASPPDNAPTVSPPANIRLEVYSQTAIELFWDRVSGQSLTYEIRRNGVLLEITDGSSHFDSSLNASDSYIYEVVAINVLGARSSGAEVQLSSAQPSNPDSIPEADPEINPVPLTFDLSEAPVVDIAEPLDYYQRDGYSDTDVIRVDVRTVTTPGVCTADDLSGCTLDDVLADIDKTDELKVEIDVHVTADDFADDGSISNATMRIRGGGSRLGAQKSFRIKLDSKQDLWRNERFWQLNKTPFSSSRIRNPLSFKVMSEIPHLPSVRTQFVNLWIDDGDGPVDQGLYHHVERINETYLDNRGLDDDGNLYDAEDFTFSLSDLSDVSVDDEGEPLNEDFFESALGISEGKDHRALSAMLRALHDPDRSFESVLDQYFDKNNVMAWMAVNMLLRQNDSVKHNYFLFNPSDSEKFYFIPWDYDQALGAWNELEDSYESEALRERLAYGYASGESNVFISKFYRLPGIHQQILNAVDYIRENHVSDEFMATNAQEHIEIAELFQLRQPDLEHNPNFNAYSARAYATGLGENAEIMRSEFSIPLPPTFNAPQLVGDAFVFSWTPAFDVTGNSVSYDLEISETPGFSAADIVVSNTGIRDTENIVIHAIDADRLGTRDYYARLTARVSTDPDRFWQVSLNRLTQGGQTYRGVMRFDVTE